MVKKKTSLMEYFQKEVTKIDKSGGNLLIDI